MNPVSVIVIDIKQEMNNGKIVDWVLLGPRGENADKTQTWHRVDKIRPPENPSEALKNSDTYAAMRARWAQIEPHYQEFKTGNEVPETGTPLGMWPVVSTAMADAMKKMGFTTVESVTEMTDADVEKLPFPNARKIPQLAREFVEGKDVAELQAQNEALAEKLAALEAAVNAEKPKRGRPRKVETAEQ